MCTIQDPPSGSRRFFLTGKRHEHAALMSPYFLYMQGMMFLGLILILASSLATCGQPPAQSGMTTAPTPTIRTLPTPSGRGISSSASPDSSVEIAVVNDVIYAGTSDDALDALHTKNGSRLWHTRIDGPIEELPVVAHGVVYVSSLVGPSGPAYLTAVRAQDGTVLWRYQSNSYIYQPAVTDSVVYVSTQGNGITALRASNGTQLWHIDGTLHQTPVLRKGVLYVSGVLSMKGKTGVPSDGIYALHAADGSELWYDPINDMEDSTFTLQNGIIYAYMAGKCAALRASDGHVLWNRAIDGTFALTPQVIAGVVYLAVTKMILETPSATTQYGGEPPQLMSASGLLWTHEQTNTGRETSPLKQGRSSLYALQADNGTQLWQHSVNQGKDGFVNWLQVAQDTVYISTDTTEQNTKDEGMLSALRSNDGAIIWQDRTPGPSSGVFLSGNVMYVSIYDPNGSAVYALQSQDGVSLWCYPVSGSIYYGPILAKTTLYIGTSNGMIYALRPDNGTSLWQYGVR